MKPSKIVYLTPSVRIFGARQSLLQLVRNLSPEFKPIVVCPTRGYLSEELKNAGIQTEFIPLYPWRKGKFYLLRYLSVLKLRKLLQREKPDIIHANEFYCNPYAVKASAGLGIPVISHLRLYINDRMIRNYFLSRTSRIVTVSHATRHYLNGWNGTDSKINVIYNGIDFEELKVTEPRDAIRRKIGIGDHDFLIGQIGLYSPRKRQHTAIEVARRVVAERPECKFLFVGEADRRMRGYEQDLHRKCRQYGLENHVFFLPIRSDIASVFNAIDLNLLISSNEGFGRVIPEAACFEKPTVGTKAGGINEIIDDGTTGYLVSLDDIDAMTKRILHLASNRDFCEEMGANARKTAYERFSINQHAKNVEELYRQMLNGKAEVSETVSHE